MTRTNAADLTLFALLALTAATWALAESSASAMALAGVAVLKATAIGLVFLELDRARVYWALGFVAVVGAIAGGAAWLAGLG